MNSISPKVFVSYSHDSEIHRSWILEFATKLMTNGVEVVLDQWDLKPGMDLVKFMENGLNNSSKVIIVYTKKYSEKSNKGLGGVGYETILAQGEFLKDLSTEKFIPIKREKGASIPNFLGTRLYLDFTNSSDFKKKFEDLLKVIHGYSIIPKPKIGDNPFTQIDFQNKEVVEKIKNENLNNSKEEVVLKAWMDSGESLEKVEPFVLDWLRRNKESELAAFFLSAWLDLGGSLEKVEPYVFDWLKKNNESENAVFILNGWINSGGSLEKVEPYVFEWLKINGTEQGSKFIITSWLQAGGSLEKVEPYVFDWLKKNNESENAVFILNGWINSGGSLEKVAPYVFEWLKINGTEQASKYILTSWLKNGGNLEKIAPYVFKWLEINGHKQDSNFLITSWIKAGGTKERMKPYLNEWLNRFS